MRIGISISESPDLSQRGLSLMHLQDAMVAMARYLLAHGEHLAYGGDLREQGFTHLLFELVKTYAPPGADRAAPGEERVESYLAWPLHLQLDEAVEESLVSYARVHRLAPPEDLEVDEAVFLPWGDARSRYVWARSISAMREELNRRIDARLLLGGQLSGYKGVLPGLAEEAYLTLREGKPLFLLGGFGGCTAAVIEALKGGAPRELTTEHRKSDAEYQAMVRYYQDHPSTEVGPDFDLVAFFQKAGPESLRNGLSREENERLFETVYIEEMATLLLKGIEAIRSRAA